MIEHKNKFSVAFQYLLSNGIVKSQEDFANKLQEDAGNISKYLNDKQDVPLHTIQKLITNFELDANFFFYKVNTLVKYQENNNLQIKLKEQSAVIFMQKRTINSMQEQINNLQETIDLLMDKDIVDVKAEEVKEQRLLP